MNFAYSNQKNILSASTDDGQIVMWKRRLEIKGDVRSITWELFGTIPTGVNALNITWGKIKGEMV